MSTGRLMSVVNGFVCRSSCDEAVARKGHDPRNPSGNPVKQAELDARDGRTSKPKIAFDDTASTVSTGPGPLGYRPPGVGLLADVSA